MRKTHKAKWLTHYRKFWNTNLFILKLRWKYTKNEKRRFNLDKKIVQVCLIKGKYDFEETVRLAWLHIKMYSEDVYHLLASLSGKRFKLVCIGVRLKVYKKVWDEYIENKDKWYKQQHQYDDFYKNPCNELNPKTGKREVNASLTHIAAMYGVRPEECKVTRVTFVPEKVLAARVGKPPELPNFSNFKHYAIPSKRIANFLPKVITNRFLLR